uniref:2-oxoglutarate and iron dependent oxygenase domain containing 3 n=1 Tax=Hucho hucho TaxID=62062 RepID=A0A4W5JYU2_9TELE
MTIQRRGNPKVPDCSEDYETYKRYPGGFKTTPFCIEFACFLILFFLPRQASILDLHSGALLMGKQFVNIYRYFGEQIMDVFSDEDFRLYREVRGHIQAVPISHFYPSFLPPFLSSSPGSETSTHLSSISFSSLPPPVGVSFSSGSKNLHRVEQVSLGTRYAITVSFTCDPAHAIADPAMPITSV